MILDGTEIDAVSGLIRVAAKSELMERFQRIGSELKADGSLVTEADGAMQRLMQQSLKVSFPEFGFVGEEMDESEMRDQLVQGRPLWCLDPLDGTSNYAAGMPFFAVSLALIVDGHSELGWVYDPIRDELFSAIRNGGAWCNGKPLGESPSRPLQQSIAVVDFKRIDAVLSRRLVTSPPYASQRNPGACALEWCWLAAGRFHLYLHGGMKLWDYAAGALILAESGGAAHSLEGGEVFEYGLASRSVVGAAHPDDLSDWYRWLQSQ